MVCVLIIVPKLSSYGQSNVVIYDLNDKMLQVGKYTSFLEDKTNSLTLEDVLKRNVQLNFQSVESKTFNLPPSDETIWFKVTLQNQSSKPIWFHVGDNYNVWELDFYIPDEDGHYTTVKELGALRSQDNKEFDSHHYVVELPRTDQPVTYYFSIYTQQPKAYAFQIGTNKAISTLLNKYEFGSNAFLAVVLAMFIYNIFIFYSTGDRIYLVYSMYLVCILFNIPFYSGDPHIDFPWLYYHIFSWHIPMFVFKTWFATKYLSLKKYSTNLHYWLLFLTFVIVVVFGILNITILSVADLYGSFDLVATVYMFSLLGCGLYVWIVGKSQSARFYVLAWFFVFFGALMFILTANGVLPLNYFTRHGMYLGYGLETLLFALALGNRLNTLKLEKEQAQARNLALVKQQNEVLEQKVLVKTQELRQANDELTVNNEELEQTQEELSAQRDLLELNNHELKEYQKRISQNIQSAKTIQNAILPTTARINAHFANHFILYLPKDIVSGDFYWMAEHKDRVIFIEADCTGHGVSGAFTTLIGHAVFNYVVRIKDILEPAQILENIHQQFQEILQQKETNNLDGMDLSILVVEKHNSGFTVKFGGAGQRFSYIVDGEINTLSGSRKRIGGVYDVNDKRKFSQSQLLLPAGAMLYLYSDGFIDQNNDKRERFGSKNFLELINSLYRYTIGDQKEQLVKALKNHQGDEEQRDDITVVGLQL